MEHIIIQFRPIIEPEVWKTKMRQSKCTRLTYSKYSPRRRLAFSLIELLVVIAIITLLTALLFPVFSTARENARESSTITHMQEIQSGLALYKLDNHAYPQVLFGYAIPGTPMSDAAAIGNASAEYGSLFPTYVNDFHAFESQDNPDDDNLSQTVTLISTELGACTPAASGCTQLNEVPRTFYTMDGMDVSPQVAPIGTNNEFVGGNNAPTTYQYVLRYQRDWMNVHALNATPTTGQIGLSGTIYTNYLHQLRWQNPPADTYVTSVTYHVPNANKIIVLFESGSAIKMQATQYGGYDDTSSCWNTYTPSTGPAPTETCTLTTEGGSPGLSPPYVPGGDNPAAFWQVANTQ